jgi:hypothetical protein
MDPAVEAPGQLCAWTYVRTGEGEFRRVGLLPFCAFFGQRVPFPVPVQDAALTAEFLVLRAERQVLRLWSADFRRYDLTPDGFYDPGAKRGFGAAYVELNGVLDAYGGRLEKLIADPTPVLSRVLTVAAEGRALFEAVQRLDLEGIVAKPKADPYRPDTVWYKIKSRTYTQGEGRWELFQKR